MAGGTWATILALALAGLGVAGAVAAQLELAHARRRLASREDRRLADFGKAMQQAVQELAALAQRHAEAEARAHRQVGVITSNATRLATSARDAEARLTGLLAGAEQAMADGTRALRAAADGAAPLAGVTRDLPGLVQAALAQIEAAAIAPRREGTAEATLDQAGLQRLETVAARLEGLAPDHSRPAVDLNSALAPVMHLLDQLLLRADAASSPPPELPASVIDELVTRVQRMADAVAAPPGVADSLAEAATSLERQGQAVGTALARLAAQSERADAAVAKLAVAEGLAAQLADQARQGEGLLAKLTAAALFWPDLTKAMAARINAAQGVASTGAPPPAVAMAWMHDLEGGLRSLAQDVAQDRAALGNVLSHTEQWTAALARAAAATDSASARLSLAAETLPARITGQAAAEIATAVTAEVAQLHHAGQAMAAHMAAAQAAIETTASGLLLHSKDRGAMAPSAAAEWAVVEHRLAASAGVMESAAADFRHNAADALMMARLAAETAATCTTDWAAPIGTLSAAVARFGDGLHRAEAATATLAAAAAQLTSGHNQIAAVLTIADRLVGGLDREWAQAASVSGGLEDACKRVIERAHAAEAAFGTAADQAALRFDDSATRVEAAVRMFESTLARGAHALDEAGRPQEAAGAAESALRGVQEAAERVALAAARQDGALERVVQAQRAVDQAKTGLVARPLTPQDGTPALVAAARAASDSLLRQVESLAEAASSGKSVSGSIVPAEMPHLLRDIEGAIHALQGAATAVAMAGDALAA